MLPALPHDLLTYLATFAILLSTLLTPSGASARAVDEPAAPDAPAMSQPRPRAAR